MAEDEKKAPTATVPARADGRTPTGQWAKGVSGRPQGRPAGAVAQFSRELKEAFGEHFATVMPDGRTKGQNAIERVWKEKPDAYLGLAVRMVPQQVRIEEGRATAEMSDEELVAIVRMTRTRRHGDEDDDGADGT